MADLDEEHEPVAQEDPLVNARWELRSDADAVLQASPRNKAHSSKKVKMNKTDVQEVALEDSTYVPTVPSRHGETSDEKINEYDTAEKRKGTAKVETEKSVLQRGGGRLGNQERRHFTAMAIPQKITSIDEPSLGVALQSPESTHWLTVIKEEVSTMNDKGVWKVHTRRLPVLY